MWLKILVNQLRLLFCINSFCTYLLMTSALMLPVEHRPQTTQLQLCSVLLPPSSSSCTKNLPSTYFSPDLFYRFLWSPSSSVAVSVFLHKSWLFQVNRLHTSCLTPSHPPSFSFVSEMTYNVSMGTLNPTIPYLLRQKKEEKGRQWRKRSEGKAHFMRGNWVMFQWPDSDARSEVKYWYLGAVPCRLVQPTSVLWHSSDCI